jgi:flagellar L-ring protein precursor FlgH
MARHVLMTAALMLAVLPAAGCVTTAERPASGGAEVDGRIPPRYSLPLPVAAPETPPEGSIYAAGDKSLYSDNRAREVGDVIMVKIVENSSADKKASTKTQRDSQLTGGVASLFGLEKWAQNHNANFIPSTSSLNAGLKNNYNGTGETKRDSTVTATISARVVDKTMDGNLVIRGYREVRVNNETQHIIVSGIIRPQDVGADNSILSSYIADARIETSGTGVLADKQQPGWLARGLDVIWPF